MPDRNERREARRLRRRRPRRQDRRAVYLLPNLITSASLMLGFWSIVLSMPGEYQNFERSALCIFLAGIADMLDGRIARATHATSKFGTEYDSICDTVSFGVAPAILMYNWVLAPLGPRAWMIAALFTLCAALRLARFNVSTQDGDSSFYQGVPSTFAGGMVAVTLWFLSWLGTNPPFDRPLRLGLTIGFAAIALLMVSPIPYPSLKLIKIEGRRAYPTLVAILLGTVAVLLNHEPMLFAIGISFLTLGPFVALHVRRNAAQPLEAAAEPSPESPDV